MIPGALRILPLAVLLVACRGEQQAAISPESPARPDGPVADAAEVIPATAEAALDARLREYWDQEKTAIVVNTITDLDGVPIERYATRTFNDWGIGDDETDRGVLIVVSRDDRKLRIEVGCGLETVLTNDVAARIIEQDMVPLFASGDFPGGINAGVDSVVTAIAESEVEPGPLSPWCLEQAA